MNGVTGRMAPTSTLIRSISSHIDQGGVKLLDPRSSCPTRSCGRSEEKLKALAARNRRLARFSTNPRREWPSRKT